jgi:hypothetical protein
MKKQLLKEAEIRKMMKFANISALSNGFVERLNEQEEILPDEEEGGGMTAGDAPMSVDPDAEAEPDMSMDPDAEEAPEEAGDEVLDAVKGVVDNLKLALSAAGPEGQAAADAIFVEGGEGEEAPEGGMEDLGDEEGAMDMAGGPEDLPVPEEEPVPGEEEMVAELQVVDEGEDEDEMLNEVARRVARRLNLLKRQKEML